MRNLANSSPLASHKYIIDKVNITYTVEDLPEYLRKRVKVAESGCWEWQANLNQGGYGRVNWGGRLNRMAHKVVFEFFGNCIEEGLEVDHLCYNRRCVNPAHLEAVTPAENLRRSHVFGSGNGTRTHCRHGHALTPENIYSWRGKRFCLKCQQRRQRTYLNKKAEAQNASA